MVLHLTKHETAYRVAEVHKYPQQLPCQPHARARHKENNRYCQMGGPGPREPCKPHVPLIPFVNNASETAVDLAHKIGEPHAGALREMAQFMGKNASKLTHIKPSGQRQTDRQNQILAQKTAAQAC